MKRKSAKIGNPHYYEPVLDGLYCWRINNESCWDSQLFESEEEAFKDAVKHCLNLGVGKHTVHLGMTNTTKVECVNLIDEHRKRLVAYRYDQDLMYAMGLPESLHSKTSSEIAEKVAEVLKRVSKECKETSIKKIKHRYCKVIPKDIGINVTNLSELVEALRKAYGSSNKEWVKVASLQNMVVEKAKEIIEELGLPMAIENIRIWQGIERTRNRLHIVCDAPFSDGRFHRLQHELLCTKEPKTDDGDRNEPTPCLACLDRLVKIESKLRVAK